MKEIIIIGGGICGLSTAYYLNQNGYQITIIDGGDLTNNCSFGNAGYISPSHFIPLAAPGVIKQGIKWMFDSSSPLFIRPSLNPSLLRWMYLFQRASKQKTVDKVAPALLDFHLFSKRKYEELSSMEGFNFHYKAKGLLMLCQKDKKLRTELLIADQAQKLGLVTRVVSKEGLSEMEPDTRINALGGVYYEDDAHVMPNELMNQLINHLKGQKNVNFLLQKEVSDFDIVKGEIKSVILEDKSRISGDQVLLATGAFTGKLAQKLNLNLPMQGGKGYSISYYNLPTKPKYPAILSERKIAISTAGPLFRIGGTMEIDNFNIKPRKERIKAILSGFKTYYPELKLPSVETKDFWFGFRPCSPDGLPYIGRIPGLENAFLSAGHGMLGISLGLGTGWVNSQLIQGKNPGVDISNYSVDRYY